MDGMKQVALGLGIAVAGTLAACGPQAPAPVAGVGGGAGAKPKASAAPATTPTKAAGILGKMKEPVGLVRQAAFVASLHDALPITLASGGVGSLSLASSLVSNNGGALISDAGGNAVGAGAAPWRLLQAPVSLLPEYTRVRQDVVLHQRPVGLMSAVLSLYDPKAWDPKAGADNEAALLDRYHMDVADFRLLAPDELTFDLDLKVLSSRRIPFVDKLVMSQHVKKAAASGKFQSTRMAYRMGFDVALADGAVDRADLTFVAEAADLAPALDEDGDATVSYEPRRMALTGTNGHGTYGGEALFPPGGAITGRFTHARADGAKAVGEFTIRPDGTSTGLASSLDGRLALAMDRAADGTPTLEVRDLADGAATTRADALTLDGGVATLDLGEETKPRVRIF